MRTMRMLIAVAVIFSATQAKSITFIEYSLLTTTASFAPPGITAIDIPGNTLRKDFYLLSCAAVGGKSLSVCENEWDNRNASTSLMFRQVAAVEAPFTLEELVGITAQEVLEGYGLATPLDNAKAFAADIQTAQLDYVTSDPSIAFHSVTYYLPTNLPPEDSGELIDGYVIHSSVVEGQDNDPPIVAWAQVTYDQSLDGAVGLFLLPEEEVLDSDGDGVFDYLDSCPFDADDDLDGDGFCADVDNCPLVENPDQSDSDDDGVGDLCDEGNGSSNGGCFVDTVQ